MAKPWAKRLRGIIVIAAALLLAQRGGVSAAHVPPRRLTVTDDTLKKARAALNAHSDSVIKSIGASYTPGNGSLFGDVLQVSYNYTSTFALLNTSELCAVGQGVGV